MFLVMEHLEGETLAQRLDRGPLPIEQTLSIATEIADALSVAHRAGTVVSKLRILNSCPTASTPGPPTLSSCPGE